MAVPCQIVVVDFSTTTMANFEGWCRHGVLWQLKMTGFWLSTMVHHLQSTTLIQNENFFSRILIES